MQLVWEKDLPQSRKFLLLALADQANDAGECWPAINTLAARCSMGRRTVFDSLADLESEEWLERELLPNQRVRFHLNIAKLQQLALDPAAERRAQSAYRGTRATTDQREIRTSAKSAPVPNPHQCEDGTGADSAKTGAKSALHKATPSKATPIGGDTRTRAEQLEAMGRYDRSVIAPFLDELPEGIETQTFADFVKHRKAAGRVLSISSWRQVLAELRALEAQGVDLNDSLRRTAALGLAVPVDPRPKSRAGPKRPRANDDFTNVRYQGTADDDLPAELRNNHAAGAV